MSHFSTRLLLMTSLASGMLVFAGCATPEKGMAPGEGQSTLAEMPPLPAPPAATKVVPPRGSRKERLERGASRNSERGSERMIDRPGDKPTEKVAVTDAILFECIVRLPDDPTENRELCRSFRMTIEDADGAEVARFRFGLDGSYRFTAAKAGVKYRLRTSTGKNWVVSIDPARDLVIGDQVRVELRQKE